MRRLQFDALHIITHNSIYFYHVMCHDLVFELAFALHKPPLHVSISSLFCTQEDLKPDEFSSLK